MEGDTLLEIITEYRKGIFFVRLIGSLTKENIYILEKEVISIIQDNQIRNVVINLDEIKELDIKGINMLFYIYELSKKNKGRTLICEPKNEEIKKRLKSSRVLNYMKQIKNELVAFELIQI